MADTGASDRKPRRAPGAQRRGSASVAAAARAPCCGLPSPLASAIRVTVAARPEPPAALPVEIEPVATDSRETF